MINLLPEDRKREIRAARINVFLLRYNFLTVGAVVLIAIFCAGTFMVLQNGKQSALTAISENEAKTSSLNNVRSAADTYRQNLALAGKIIDNGVSYTDIIIGITELLPKGTVLDGLALNGISVGPNSVSQQITFQAKAKSYAVAEALKCQFEQSTLFTDVYFQGLSEDTTDNKSPYPVKVSMSAKLKTETKIEQQAKDETLCSKN